MNHTLTVMWPLNSLRDVNDHLYPNLTASTKQLEDRLNASVTISGPLESLAYWVLIEHCGGDLGNANDVIKTAVPDPCRDERCNRCGCAEMAKVQVTLCEDCDHEVTSVQAHALLETKAKFVPVTFTANPKRTRI